MQKVNVGTVTGGGSEEKNGAGTGETVKGRGRSTGTSERGAPLTGGSGDPSATLEARRSSALCPRRFQGNAGSARPTPDAPLPDAMAPTPAPLPLDAPLPPYPQGSLLPALAPGSQTPAQKI